MSAKCEPNRVSVNQVAQGAVSVSSVSSAASAASAVSAVSPLAVAVCSTNVAVLACDGAVTIDGALSSVTCTNVVSCAVTSTSLLEPICSGGVPVASSQPCATSDDVIVRDARRRERRERRQQRRVNSSQNQLNAPTPPSTVWSTRVDPLPVMLEQRLPDLLSAHMPPAYSTLPSPSSTATPLAPSSTPTSSPPPHVVAHVAPSDGRFPFQAAPANRRRLRRGGERRPKSCCGLEVTQTVSIRWFVVVIAFVGVCCAVVGTTLGAMEASGRDHLTVSLLMIGVGVVLVTVSGVAWRLTANDAPSCRAMLGLGRRGNAEASGVEPNRRFVPRLPPSFGRPHHPYAAMLYPEFAYRPPPPSYAASMQEYRLRLLLSPLSPLSPPPQYRTGTATATPASANHGTGSRPPSYRCRMAAGQSGVSVIAVPGDSTVPDSLKLSPDGDLPSEPAKSCVAHGDEDSDKEGNLVTIVSTGGADAVVTVTTTQAPQAGTELDILAHL